MLKTQAIVLSSLKYGETSLILQMYTREEGRASFIVSGVRKNKAKIGSAHLQPGYINDIIAYYKPGDRLNRLKEIKPSIIYKNIPFKIYKRAVCVFAIELLSRLILEDDANPELFDFLTEFLQKLDGTSDSVANFPMLLMYKLSAHQGFEPNDNFSKQNTWFDLIDGQFKSNAPDHRHFISEPLSEIFQEVLKLNMENIHKLKLSRSDRTNILNTLIDYFKIHIDGFTDLHSQKIFAEILG